MTTGPWDPRPVAGRSRLRASDADREHVVDTLKDAFVQGMLDKDEFDIRAGRALTSRTFAELTAVIRDIPLPTRLTGPRPPQSARPPARKTVNKKAVAWVTCAIVLPPALSAAFLTYYGGFLVLFLFAFIGLTVTTGP